MKPDVEATLRQVEDAIESLGPGTEEYHEAMAYYLMTMARAQWRRADQARARRVRREALERGEVRAQ